MRNWKKLFAILMMGITVVSAASLAACGGSNQEEHLHTLTVKEAKEATCAEEGNHQYWYCVGCGKYFSDADAENETTLAAVTLARKDHELAKTFAAEADCTTDGNSDYWYCLVCENYFSDENGEHKTTLEAVTVKAAHKLTHRDAVEAGCMTDGTVEHWECSVCEKLFADADAEHEKTAADLTVPATNHQMTNYPAVAAQWKVDGNIEYWTCSACGKYYADEAGENELAESDTVIVNEVLPTDTEELGHTIANSSTSTSFWKVTDGNTSFSGGWYPFGSGNLGGYGGGTGLPVLHGTEDAPEYLEFTAASRFELFHVKDDKTNPGSVSYIHLGDNGQENGWGNNKHNGLFDYAYIYNFDVTANGAFAFEVCGTSGAKADQSSNNAGLTLMFNGNVINMVMANTVRAKAVFPETFDFGDGEHHSIAISLNRWGTRQLDVKVYIDGYMAQFMKTEGLTKNTANDNGYIAMDDGLYNGFGQRFSVIPQVNSAEGAETTTYSTVCIYGLSVSRINLKGEESEQSVAVSLGEFIPDEKKYTAD